VSNKNGQVILILRSKFLFSKVACGKRQWRLRSPSLRLSER